MNLLFRFAVFAAMFVAAFDVRAIDPNPVIPDTCGLPEILTDQTEGFAGTTIGNYQAYARTTAAPQKRFLLPGTSFDLQGLAEQGDLGTVIPPQTRSQLIGLFYTFEQLDPALPGNNNPTYPVWYMIERDPAANGTATRYDVPIRKYTFDGQFSSGGGQRSGPIDAGLLSLQQYDTNKRFNAVVQLNGKTAYYCLQLADLTPANTDEAPGSSVQGIWGAPIDATAFTAGSVTVTRGGALRGVLTFFDERGANPGQPVWAYSDLPVSPTQFPVNVASIAAHVPYNGETWYCNSQLSCVDSGLTRNVGSLQPIRLGTTTGNDQSLNIGSFKPTIDSTIHNVVVRWAPASPLPLVPQNCMVRMDATPTGLTPGSVIGQNNCPESTPDEQALAYFTCATPQGQSSCPVTLRWRVTDAFPHARMVAFDEGATGSAPIPVASSGTLVSTGTTFSIPAGKKYRFAILSGTSDQAPVIGRAQTIQATSAPTAIATGCTITSGTTCQVGVVWSGGTGAPALYRYNVTTGAAPTLVSNLASGNLSHALPVGSYRYDLHSASPPTLQNRLATSNVVAVTAGPSSVSVSPTTCTIVSPATTCSASVSWSTTQVAMPFLFRVGVSPPVAAQSVAISAQSGSVSQSLGAGVYRFELRSTNDASSGANLLATSTDLTVAGGSGGAPAVPPAPVEPAPPTSDPESENVGFTGGVFRVDEVGNATYRVALTLPPGRAGLTPQLALTYSSGTGDGIAGWGTVLEGVGVIARCRLSVEAGDGVNRAIGLAPDSYGFCLNGQRLIKVSPDGTTPIEYRTEIESYQRIVVDGFETVLPNGGGTAFSQPTSFTVYSKDGLIARYGTGAARRRAVLPAQLGTVEQPFVEEWWLASLADRNENEIAFDYTGSTAAGSLQLDRIRYEGGQVDFTYDPRTPVVSFGAWGARLQNDRLLKFATVSNGVSGSAPLLRYELSYEALPSNGALRRLASLATCHGTICQAPTIFDWYDRPSGTQDSAGQGNAPGGGANFQDIRAYKYGDVNGDGRADLVWVDKTKALRISLSQPSAGGGIAFAATTTPTSIECERNSSDDVDDCSMEGYQRTWALFDYNADGRDDLIFYQTNPSLRPTDALYRAWRVWLSNGSTFVPSVDLAEAPENRSLPGTPRLMLADFDGDGLGDLLTNRAGGFGTDIRVYLLRKSGNGAAPFQFSTPYAIAQENADGSISVGGLCNFASFVSANGDRGDAIDFNGDGNADLALRRVGNTCTNNLTGGPTENWIARQASEPGSAIVDMNSQGTAIVFASKGLDAQGRFVFKLMPSLLGLDAANAETLRFGDINGDGYVDALVRRGGNTTPGLNNWDEVWGYFYGTPQGWEGPLGGYCVRKDTAGNCQPMGRQGQVSLLDHDGDGRLDVWSRRFSSSASGDFTYDVMLWDGNGFQQPVATFFQGGDSTWMRGNSDLDGDGDYDNLIMRSTEVGASWKARRTAAHHKPRNLLQSIGYGLGATTYIDYAPLTFSTVYQRRAGAVMLTYGRGSIVQDVLAPRYVVKRVRSSAPTASNPSGMAEMQYRYAGFRMQGGGRGGLGFAQTLSVDVENALTTQTEYNQHFPLIGLPKRTLAWSEAARADDCADPDAAACMTWTGWIASAPAVVYTASGDTWRWEIDGVATSNPDLSTMLGQNRKPVRVLRSFSSSYKREAAGAAGFVGATQTTFGSYDAYGNLLGSTTVDFDDEALGIAARTVTTSNTYDNDAARWILGRLRQASVTTSRPGMPSNVRSTTFDYHATTGQLEVERLQPGGSSSETLIKVHKYDGYGNEIRTIACSRSVIEEDCKNKPAGQVVFQSSDDQYVQRMSGRDPDNRGLYFNSEWEVFKPSTGVDMRLTSFVGARDDFGNPTSVYGTNGLHAVSAYDGFGRLYFSGDNTGGWSSIERRWCSGYTGSGVGARVTCPTNAAYRVRQSAASGPAVWTYRDKLDREVLKVSESLQANEFSAVRTSYDKLGRVAAVSQPYFTFSPSTSSVGQPNAAAIYETSTQYDAFGRVRLVIHSNNGVDGLASQTETIYGARKVTIRLPQNANGVAQTTVREVNALGELYKVTDHLGSTVTYRFDAAGNVVEVARQTYDGKSASTTATYDGLGRKLTTVDPDRGTWNFRYNALGEVVRKWNVLGGTCEQQLYDARGRVYARRNYPNASCTGGTDASTDWIYDTAANGLGLPDVITHIDDTQPYSRVHRYDSFGRPLESTSTLAGSDYTNAMTYDQYGRVFQQFFSGSGIPRAGELHQYNERGFATTVRDAFPGVTGQVYYELLAVDAAGRAARERRVGSDNLVTTKTYAPSTGRLSAISTGASVQQLAYGYDPLGNMSWREDRSGGGFLRETFGYDNLQRLTATTGQRAGGVQEQTFVAAYDGLGNNTSHGMGEQAADCHAANEVDPGPGAISTLGSNQFCYDARGNQVRTVDRANPSGMEKRKIGYSSYDLARDIRSNNPYSAHVSQFVYGPERTMVLRRDYGNAIASGTPQLTYYAGGAEIIIKSGSPKEVRRNVADVLLTRLIDVNGNVVSVVQDVLLTDALGSTHRITDTTGTPRSANGTQQFTPFGARASTTSGAILDGANRFNFDDSRTRDGFTGHQQIDANGLIHMGARLYDPVLARFVQADSIVPDAADLQQLNRYTYVSNNPLAYTDPTGHWGAQQQGYLRVAGAIVITVATVGTAGPVVGQMTWTQMGIYMAGGFASGALTSGNLRGAVTGSFTSLALAGVNGKFIGQEKSLEAVLAHAAAGGVVEQINGGKFGHGFIAAGFTAAFVPYVSTGSEFADGILHSVIGGTASEVSGGKFANGALTAAFGYVISSAGKHYAQNKHGSGKIVTDPAVGEAATEAANLALGDGLTRVFETMDDASKFWTDTVLPIAKKFDTEIASKFFRFGKGVRIGSALSSGVICSLSDICRVNVPLAGDVMGGTLSGWIHSHPLNEIFSPEDLGFTFEQYQRVGAHQSAYVGYPNGQIHEWSTRSWAENRLEGKSTWRDYLKYTRQVR